MTEPVEPDLIVEHEHTTHSQGFYIAIGIVLLILTVTTAAVAFVNLGPFNPVVALLIATIKATLVVLFFMHGKYSPKRTQLVIICSVFWLAIMLALTLADYDTRSHETQPGVSRLAPPAVSHFFAA